MENKIRDALIDLIRAPDTDRTSWLEGAASSVEFLKNNFFFDHDHDILLYASGPCFSMHSVLVSNAALDPPDHADLLKWQTMPDDTWSIQWSYDGEEGRRAYLKPPLSQPGCESLVGGEKLIFLRDFDGAKSPIQKVEISQKLVHSLNLHFLEERHAYCRLDNRGDLEKVIRVYSDELSDPSKNILAVSIRRHDLNTYMTISEMSLVARFDFTRFVPDQFSPQDGADKKVHESHNFYYKHGVLPGHASYANGHIILRTNLTEEHLIEEWKAEDDAGRRQYATFKIIDTKNDRHVEASCSPAYSVDYSTESDLPYKMSPAFFRPEVLHRFKADPEKYTISDRSINCRNTWSLKTYDINNAGQVHTYICYLADLPYEEQLYWKSFNEWPKANISKRALQTDNLAQLSTVDEPLAEIKEQIKSLDLTPPSWWKPRGKDIIDEVLYPSTDSVKEWGNEVLALDHLVVEGFLEKGLRGIIRAKGGTFEKDWRSLKLLEVALSMTGRTEDQAKKITEPLKELNHLRNKAKAHSDTGKTAAVISARKQYGTLRNQFSDLAARVRGAMKLVIETLPKT